MQMQAPREPRVSPSLRPVPPPRLLVEPEPWARIFLRNLRDALRPPGEAHQMLTSKPAPFWPDVFVGGGISRRSLGASALYHIALVFVLWALSSTFFFGAPIKPDSFFKNRQITYYDVSEYLPPIDTGSPPAKVAKKGEPEFSKQPIISVPPIPDNSTQTIIDPLHPQQLKQEQRLPNMMVWTQTPAPPVPGRDLAKLTLPRLPSVIAPAIQAPARDLSQLNLPKLRAEAVAPAPDVSDPQLAKLPVVAAPGAIQPVAEAGTRTLGELNIGHSDLVVSNPALPVPEQRAANLLSGTDKNALAGGAGAVVPPAPSVDSGGGSGLAAQGQFVALSVRPAPPNGPIDAPSGNRRGIFAATPEGKPGAPGTPDLAGGGSGDGAGGTGSGTAGPGSSGGSAMPGGIHVGGMPGGPSSGGAVVAAAAPPPHPAPVTGDALRRALNAAAAPKSAADLARQTSPRLPDEPSKIEDKVFGSKKYYSMILNMPNLTSAGGSWIIRFAELHGAGGPGELTAPVAMSKVDPAYPPELIRKNVEGTVALYAVIHADGTVGEIRILESVDDRLDENARRALSLWHFRPARKNGNAVDLEAVVFIPFKVRKSNF